MPEVKRAEIGQLIRVEREIKNGPVFNHALLMRRFWDGTNAALHKEAQRHLSRSFTVRRADTHESGIGKNVLASAGKRRPRLGYETELPVTLHQRGLLAERM